MSKIYLFILLLLNSSVYAQKPFAVVELFTSEGCSSCPPADAILSRNALESEQKKDNVIYLAYHVDYWNHLGWKDPYSKYQFTIRQENYSRVLADKEVFTPEAVVNGTISLTGSREDELKKAIGNALDSAATISLSMKIDSLAGDSVFISYKCSATNPNYVLRLALTESNLKSNVGKGENEGKLLKHDHVVRSFISMNDVFAAGHAAIAIKELEDKSHYEVVGFIQHKQSMKILAADKIFVGK